jgi:hypothetical protein
VGYLLAIVVAFQVSPVRPEPVTLRGEVVELSRVLDELGIPSDRGPGSQQVVLKAEDGIIVPLLADEATRAFAADERLRRRPVELQARRFAGLPYVQVTAAKVEHEGKLRTPEYYCDICTISVRYPQDCPCCQGPMELRMKPERP